MEQRESGSTKFDAMEVVTKEFYSNAELRSQINKAEKFHGFGKYIKSIASDELNRLEESLIKFDRMAQLEHEIWAGNANNLKFKEYRTLQSKMGKQDLILREKLSNVLILEGS